MQQFKLIIGFMFLGERIFKELWEKLRDLIYYLKNGNKFNKCH